MNQNISLCCEICRQVSNNCYTFGCGHHCCHKCTLKIIFLANLTEIAHKEIIQVKCMCNAGVLDVNTKKIYQMLSIKDENEVSYCRKHQRQRKYYCSDCRDWLCDKCAQVHSEQNSYHRISMNSEISDTAKCSIHKNADPEFFCIDCQEEICKSCCTAHSRHQVAPIAEYAEALRGKTLYAIALKHSSYEEFSDYFDQTCSQCINSIKAGSRATLEKINSLMQTLEYIQKEYIAKINNYLERAEMVMSIIKLMYQNFYCDLHKAQTSVDITLLQFIGAVKWNDFNIKVSPSTEVAEAIANLVKGTEELLKLNPPSNYDFIFQKQNDFQSSVKLSDHREAVHSLIHLEDGRLVSGSEDQTIRVWSKIGVSNYQRTQVLKNHNGAVTSLIELKDGRVVSGSADENIILWGIITGTDFTFIQGIQAHKGAVNSIIQLGDEQIASASSDKTIKLWKITDRYCNLLLTISGHTSDVTSLLLLEDGRLASGSDDSTIRIWSYVDNKCVQALALTDHRECICSLIQLKDGRMLSGSLDKKIRLWKVGETFTVIQVLTGHQGCVKSLIQLADGRVASGSLDGTIKIWSWTEGQLKCMLTLPGDSLGFSQLVQLKDGRIAAGCLDRTITLWS